MPDEDERLESLWRDHMASLVLYALRRCPTRADALDVVADVYLVAWRRIAEVPIGPEARPWLFGVARNVLRNMDRSERRRSRLAERLMSEVDVVVPDETVRTDDAIRLQAAIDTLEPDAKELLMLVAFDGFTAVQAATALGIDPVTARVRLHRIRAALRKRLERDEFVGHVEAANPLRVAARSVEVN